MTTCPACQREVLEGQQACPYCGVVFGKWKPHSKSPLSESVSPEQTLVTVSTLIKGCPGCGGKVAPEAVWCPHCGQPVRVKWTLPEVERVNPSPTGTMTRLITFLVLGLILFLGYQEWNRRQVETSPASVPVRPPPPPTVMPEPPAETQPSQPTQPTQPTIALSNPPDQQPLPLQTGSASVDDRKVDGQGEKQKLSRYEIPFEAYEGASKRIIISVKFNDSVTAPMLFDTGAPGMLISPKLAEKLGVYRTDEGTLLTKAGGIGGEVLAIRTIIDKVQVGGANDRFIPTTVTRSISGSFEGLIGLDFMAKYSMKIEHGKRVVVLEEIPPDPNSPGGHDEQWWRSTFREFNYYRDYFQKYREAIDKRIFDTPFGSEGQFGGLKKAVEWQYTQADKLLGRLEYYAGENGVPREWR